MIRCARSSGRAVPLILGVTVLGFGACYPRPVDPVGLPQAPSPFVRVPYIQNVTERDASVLWMSRPESVDTAWYRVPGLDSTWTGVPVRDHRRGTRRADLGPLPSSSTVEYVVSASGTRVGPHAFHTAPVPGVAGGEVRVLLFGDSGWGGPQQIDLARQMEREDWDLSIHVGDIAYDDGSESEFTERHFRVYPRTLASTPFYPSVGNHDVRADGGRSYDGAFLWPEPFAGARYYSFRWGRILFVSVDTSSDTEDVDDLRAGTGRQLEWLREVLAAGTGSTRTCDRASFPCSSATAWTWSRRATTIITSARGLSGTAAAWWTGAGRSTCSPGEAAHHATPGTSRTRFSWRRRSGSTSTSS